MRIYKKIGLTLFGLLGGLILGPLSMAAQPFPAQPIRLIVPFPPGGNIDETARIVAPALTATLHQSVVVVNMPGASGLLGASYVARSKPDGYTLLLGSTGSVGSSPALNPAATFSPIDDLTGIGGIQSVPIILTVRDDSPINNLHDLVAASKSRHVTIGSSGFGSPAHLTIEYLIKNASLNATFVPYQGSGPAITDLLGGQVSAMADQVNSSLPFLKSKKIKAIVQFGEQRSRILPDVPTLAEEGVEGFTGLSWTGIFGPAHLPAEVTQTLASALQTALSDKTVIKRFQDTGVDMMHISRPAFEQLVASDFKKAQSFGKSENLTERP
ncbi:Bug family tripartite tricarboxylate transporter substrate binding protein [Achromobacter aloeverae]